MIIPFDFPDDLSGLFLFVKKVKKIRKVKEVPFGRTRWIYVQYPIPEPYMIGTNLMQMSQDIGDNRWFFYAYKFIKVYSIN